MFLALNGLHVHVALDGPAGAPPLVLLHSLGTNTHVWDAQAAVLARSFRVIRPDLRGHGLTGATAGDYSMTMLADDLAGVLDALGVARAHIGGISIGGMIAQQFAASYPERVNALLLVDTAMVIPTPDSWRERIALVKAGGLSAIENAVIARWVTPAFLDAPETHGLRAMLRQTSVDGYAGCAAAIAVADLTLSTAKLGHKALILVGEHDQATPLAAAVALYEALLENSEKPLTLQVIEKAAHIPTVEKPIEITAAILNFLTPDGDDYGNGMIVRKQVLGAAHVARATASMTGFDRDFQTFITETAWGKVWTRPGLDHRTRSLLTLVITAALGRDEEFVLHLRASKNTGASREEIAEALLHMAVYAGVPAANAAFRAAKTLFKEDDA